MGVPGVGQGGVDWGCLLMGWGEVAEGCLGWGGTG